MNNIALSLTTKEDYSEINTILASFMKDKGLSLSEQFNKFRKNIDQKNPILDILENAQENQTIVVYDAMDLGRSTLEVIDVLNLATAKKVVLYVAKYDEKFEGGSTTDTTQFLRLLQHVESEFVVLKMTDRVGRRRHTNSPLGRPKGRKNKELKLDKHLKDIQRYLDLHISKASIAKLIGCHAQTLYNYIDKKELDKAEA
jgi:DNA invertase Pin-like site-specific DNA recombinase